MRPSINRCPYPLFHRKVVQMTTYWHQNRQIMLFHAKVVNMTTLIGPKWAHKQIILIFAKDFQESRGRGYPPPTPSLPVLLGLSLAPLEYSGLSWQLKILRKNAFILLKGPFGRSKSSCWRLRRNKKRKLTILMRKSIIWTSFRWQEGVTGIYL